MPGSQSSPYRRTRGSVPAPERHTDHELTTFGVVLWLASVLRVTLALETHEAFATEATLALACVVVLPWIFLRRSVQR